MRLVIAEKPSVAAALAAALGVKNKKDGYMEGGGYLISWCVGHLVELAEAAAYGEQYKKWSYDSLPILPQPWQYTVFKDRQKQFKILKDLMRRSDISEVVNACDAGREGELIFRLVYHAAGCDKPFSRLWISSMEKNAIKRGFAELKPGEAYDALYASALCRAKADWIIGINATRLFSVLHGKTLNVGRVQTPTLKMLADRDAAITSFKKETYHIVRLDVGGAEAASERISDAAKAEALKTACEASQAVCVSVRRERKTEPPPRLFDLTGLQREANRIYGYTAKQTLDLAQALYEKRLLTYPRTDSNYLTDDMGDTAVHIAALLVGKLPFMKGAAFTPDIARTLDSKKVSDHHAIIPTMELAKADLAALPESERNILTLAGARLLFAAAEPHIFDAVTAVFSCADTEFTAKGKTVLCDGWKEIERLYRATLKKKPDSDDENELVLDVPDFSEGQTFENPAAKVTEHATTPPKPHNEASLLSAMERAGNEDTDPDAERRGLGTPATRAAVIEKLVKGGFVERKGKQLFPTKDGTNLVCVLPDSLTSPQLTAAWENNLTQIAKGNADPAAFMQGIEAMAQELVKTYASRFRREKRPCSKRKRRLSANAPAAAGRSTRAEKTTTAKRRTAPLSCGKTTAFSRNAKPPLPRKLPPRCLRAAGRRSKSCIPRKRVKPMTEALY